MNGAVYYTHNSNGNLTTKLIEKVNLTTKAITVYHQANLKIFAIDWIGVSDEGNVLYYILGPQRQT